MSRRTFTLIATGLLASITPAVHAQSLLSSAPAAGLADNFGAVARGHQAGLWNPALLGQPDRAGFSLSLPAVSGLRGDAAVGPITAADIKPFADQVIPTTTKREWLARIRQAGGFTGSANADIQLVGLNIGPVALNAGTLTRTQVTLPPDAAELVLFGNAGEDGTPRDLDLAGAHGRAWAASFAALSMGHALPIKPFGGTLSLGVTGKYFVGHGLADLSDAQGRVYADSLVTNLRLPVIVLGEDRNGRAGSGIGVDVGAAWHRGRLTLGLTAYDVYNSFAWKLDGTRVHTAQAYLSEGTSDADVTDVPLADADAATQARAARLAQDAVFAPSTRLAAALQLTSKWLVTGDLVARGVGRGAITTGARQSVGLGTEFRYIPLIPLRAGVAQTTDGTNWGVGAGLHLGPVRLDMGYGHRSGSASTGDQLALGFSYLSRR